MDRVTRTCRLSDEEGASLIEMALVLPLLLLVFAGIVDFGLVFQRYEVVTNAAREGARIAILPGYTAGDVTARVQTYIAQGLNMTQAQVSSATSVDVQAVSIAPGGGPAFTAAQVTVVYTHTYLILGPITGLIGGGSFTTLNLTARSTMRTEVSGS
jgi:Flp pilus assembly protein TadG